MRFIPKRTGDAQLDRNLDDIASAINNLVSKIQDNGDIRIAGSLGVGNASTATSVSTLTHVVEVFDQDGTSLGYLPLYKSFS